MSKRFPIGHVLAPWPFLIFAVLAIIGGAVACPLMGAARGMMAAFDLAAIAFLIAAGRLFQRRPDQMRRAAQKNDANRIVMLSIALAVTVIILVAVGTELAAKGRPRPLEIALVVGTLCLCWLFSTVVFTLHYAHLYYTRSDDGGDSGGLCFPETKEPDYWDFVYFSSCLTMTFQTSDVDITSAICRRVVMFHSLGAFIFNIGVIAFTINILGGS